MRLAKIVISYYNTSMFPKIMLAPLSGCSDLPFRMIAREYGARFCFFEMVDANSLTHNRRQSYKILDTNEMDSPIAGQLLGADPGMMLEAAQKIIGRVKIPFLDINCACPAKKVIKKKAGAYLLRDTPRLYEILKKLIPSLPLPITIKIRIGYDVRDMRHIINLAKHSESLGVKAIFVHGRLMTQGYAGDVDYELIKKIKESVSIPVFGSGNILSAELAKKMFDETGCDGILVARGALGNPWIFKDIEGYLTNGKIPEEVTIEEKKKALKQHLHYVDKHKDISPKGKIGFMRKVAIWYLKNLPRASVLRGKITSAKSYDELINVIDY